MIEKIKALLEKYEAELDELNERYGEDFDPCDASGGNFDDAYSLGYDHGAVYGKFSVLRELLEDTGDE